MKNYNFVRDENSDDFPEIDDFFDKCSKIADSGQHQDITGEKLAKEFDKLIDKHPQLIYNSSVCEVFLDAYRQACQTHKSDAITKYDWLQGWAATTDDFSRDSITRKFDDENVWGKRIDAALAIFKDVDDYDAKEIKEAAKEIRTLLQDGIDNLKNYAEIEKNPLLKKIAKTLRQTKKKFERDMLLENGSALIDDFLQISIEGARSLDKTRNKVIHKALPDPTLVKTFDAQKQDSFDLEELEGALIIASMAYHNITPSQMGAKQPEASQASYTLPADVVPKSFRMKVHRSGDPVK